MSAATELQVARPLPGYRSKVVTAAIAVIAAGTAAAGILGTAGWQLNPWSCVALIGTGTGLVLALFQAINDVRVSRRAREVIVALSTVNTDRGVLDRWANRDHLRGVLHVTLVADAAPPLVLSSFPIRLGELLSNSSRPVVVLSALVEKKIPESPRGFELRFVPERTDQFIWLRQVYEKEALEDHLFDAQDLRRNRARDQFPPDVVIFSSGQADMRDRALALSPDPDCCPRIESQRDFSVDISGELPSVFNVLSEVRVSVSGSGDFVEAFDRSHLRERFGIYARLDHGREVSLVDFESVYSVGQDPPRQTPEGFGSDQWLADLLSQRDEHPE